ncbi:hypothetical protein DVA67_010405 [Solirubrobacter sp. CPCC 204708]|uniref:Glycosyltransferase RgtA/B/C/D-like domain-containing protein n=1 Tax=Solirubrobacter deserti TaxID=2282478 RepID=A0ABT4RTE4_9ACTN|nr:hypothetical protein [Solirubrobacter deserti]MBE2316389.1 hypothetical protein [Solirubrobacter deserti]MDA0141531.1 hypothetical protein [Solirubrobacter deserti]
MSAAVLRRAATASGAGLAVLWLAAALISGFTARRYLGPLDEGILMQAAARMADGQWPWRDFSWSYGPGQPLVVLATGESLFSWRVLRVAADATAAVLVWALVRDVRPRWAPWAWAAAAVTAAQPTSANPTAPALAFALGAVLCATRGRPAWAGALAAAAAFWRPDVGVIGALAAAAVFVAGERRVRAREGDESRCAGEARGGARAAAVALGVAAVVGLGLYAPFIVAAGPGTVWDALVVQATKDGAWWRLPFPAGFDGGDPKDFLAWLAPYAALIVLALAVPRRPAAGLVVLGAGAAIYYVSRADLEHAQGLLVVAAALAAFVRPAVVGIALLAILIVVGVGNRASALLRPPELTTYRGIAIPPEEARALPEVVARIDHLVPPGEPIYVAPRRSDLVTFTNPLLHYLTDRPNVLRRDVLLQAKPEEQRNIVRALEQRRPRVVIRWTDPASSKPEPNRRGEPSGSTALDDYLERAYRLESRFGYYDVLVSRSIAAA